MNKHDERVKEALEVLKEKAFEWSILQNGTPAELERLRQMCEAAISFSEAVKERRGAKESKLDEWYKQQPKGE